MSEVRLAAIDAGNDAIKAVFGEMGNRLYIPNVIAEEKPQRRFVELERDPLDGIHVEVISSALKQGGGIFAIGNLATSYQHTHEVAMDSVKSESDQNFLVALVALAIDAVKHFPRIGQTVDAVYNLACGLPLSEVKQGQKQRYIDRLKGATHEVRFLDTPEYRGLMVQIRFEQVSVFAEGHAALVDLSMDTEGNLRSQEFGMSTLLIGDIGGQTSDFSVVDMGFGGKLDNVNSESLREGVSPYLDTIAERVQRELGHRFRNRQDVVNTITNPLPDMRNKVSFRHTPIDHIVNEELGALAQIEYDAVRRFFAKVGNIDGAYMVGGGSVLLRPYLESLNREGYPLRFVGDAQSSIWMNAVSYFRLLQMKLQAANSNV